VTAVTLGSDHDAGGAGLERYIGERRVRQRWEVAADVDVNSAAVRRSLMRRRSAG
jgi:hypothetical protein